MGIFSFFRSGNYFDKNIAPKCDYCRYGKRAKDGNKVLCEQRGLVDSSYSCNKFIYSPLKRIPVKQLNFVGSLADEDLYSESAGERAEKEALIKAEEEAAKAERLSKEAAQHMEAKEKAERERAEKEAAAKAEAEKEAAEEKAKAAEAAESAKEDKAPEAKDEEKAPQEPAKPAVTPAKPAPQAAPAPQTAPVQQPAPAQAAPVKPAAPVQENK